MGVLGPVVQAFVGAVLNRGHDLAVGRSVEAELVGDDHPRHRTRLCQKATEEPLRVKAAPSRTRGAENSVGPRRLGLAGFSQGRHSCYLADEPALNAVHRLAAVLRSCA